jgi:mRNA interferase MazF
MNKDYIPSCGDIVWLTFNPQSGHEQSGRRPAVVISPKIYNEKSGCSLFCPITSKSKGYPFEVQLPKTCVIQGVILSDQLKSLDWQARNAEFICETPPEILKDLFDKLKTLIL